MMNCLLRLVLLLSSVAASCSLLADRPTRSIAKLLGQDAPKPLLSWIGAPVAAGIVAVATSAFVAPPPAAFAADVAHGETLFKAECAGCHAGGQNFMAEKKTLKKDALEQFRSLDPAKLKDFVQSGMPHQFLPFHSQLSDGDFEDVVGYVLDQALGEKW